ncbi:glycosyltransferase [Phreatobacter stygius]|uniref:Glycosyltransferase n=1 Tax=Phreatobacter stygius TaxID=1940610 RepID=A0A4D7AR97_9HYPH|nr:glycosyltransferase [Phreatobacter stygius]QCI63469.1 glycosyltransferase [Phreatobacter stygius]
MDRPGRGIVPPDRTAPRRFERPGRAGGIRGVEGPDGILQLTCILLPAGWSPGRSAHDDGVEGAGVRMLNIKHLVEQGLAASGAHRLGLAVPFSLPPLLVSEVLRFDRLSAVIVDSQPVGDEDRPTVAGWWKDINHSRLEIRRRLPDEMLFLGLLDELALPVLWKLRSWGVKSIWAIRPNGTFLRTSTLEALGKRIRPAIQRRIATAGLLSGVSSPVNFTRAFEDLYERLSFLRMPPDSFRPGHAALTSGTLGPGGAERQLAYTGAALARQGDWRVSVLCQNLTPPLNDFFKPSLEAAHVGVHQIAFHGPAYADPAIQEQLDYFTQRYSHIGFQQLAHTVIAHALALRDLRPQLFHTWMDAANIAGGVAAQIVGVPRLIMSGRSVAPDNFLLYQPYMRPGYLRILERGNAVIINNSTAGARDYARWLAIDLSRIAVIRNGFEFPPVPTGEQRQAARARLGVSNETVVLGGVQRFSEEKRPDLWIAAAMEAVAADRRIVAVCYGDGPMREAMIATVARAGLAERVRLPGVTRDAWESMRGFDIFMLTSRLEGLPNVLIEAQSVGLPVVTPPVGGAPETLVDGTTGILTQRQTAKALAAAVLDLAGDAPRRRQMGEHGAVHARGTFDVASMAAATLAVYGARSPQSSPAQITTSAEG